MQERHVTAEKRRFLDEGRMRRKLPTVPTLLGHSFLRLPDLGAFRWVKSFMGTMVFGRPRFWDCSDFRVNNFIIPGPGLVRIFKKKKNIHSGLRPGRIVSCPVNLSMWQQSTKLCGIVIYCDHTRRPTTRREFTWKFGFQGPDFPSQVHCIIDGQYRQPHAGLGCNSERAPNEAGPKMSGRKPCFFFFLFLFFF